MVLNDVKVNLGKVVLRSDQKKEYLLYIGSDKKLFDSNFAKLLSVFELKSIQMYDFAHKQHNNNQ